VLFAIAGVIAVAFRPVLNNTFLVNWDDDVNFLDNDGYRGIGWEQIRWAWSTDLLGVYQPLAWLLLGMEYVLWGLRPAGYFATSLTLHAANAIALYLLTTEVLRRSDLGRGWGYGGAIPGASALAVAAFALHPLRVEVVAWASCQPYLPCALFSMLAALAYLRADELRGGNRAAWLAGCWLMALAALLCKAVAVSVPFALLILDYYPLRRLGGWRDARTWRVLGEKVPFLAVACVFMRFAIDAKARGNALPGFTQYGLSERVAQSCYGPCFYAWKTLVPTDLTAYYPLPERIRLWEMPYSACAVAVAAMTWGACRLRKRYPGLIAAWVGYLVILLPNSGLVRIGNQIAADRYCYVASFPIVIAGAYALGRFVLVGPLARKALVVGAVVLTLLSGATWRQCQTWHDARTMWNRLLERGDEAQVALAHNALGQVLVREGRIDEALPHFRAALRSFPHYADAHNSFGHALDASGRSDEAMREYMQAVKIDPEHVDALSNLGGCLAGKGRLGEAEDRLAAALHIMPQHVDARNNLGMVLAQQGRFAAAEVQLCEAIRLRPSHANAHCNLAVVFKQQGRRAEAEAHCRTALRWQPTHAVAASVLDDLRSVANTNREPDR